MDRGLSEHATRRGGSQPPGAAGDRDGGCGRLCPRRGSSRDAARYALLEGARGQAPVDLDALAATLQRISQLTKEVPEIGELEINPLIVGEVGTEPYVADARMTLGR